MPANSNLPTCQDDFLNFDAALLPPMLKIPDSNIGSLKLMELILFLHQRMTARKIEVNNINILYGSSIAFLEHKCYGDRNIKVKKCFRRK